MTEKIFILRSDVPLEKEQPWYHIKNLKDETMALLPPLPPTEKSIEAGHLEWIIPDTAYNRDFVRRGFSKFHVLDQLRTQKVPEEILPTPPTPPKTPKPRPAKRREPKVSAAVDKEIRKLLVVPHYPREVKKLKSQLVEKLNELGSKPPQISTLKTLQRLLREKLGV